MEREEFYRKTREFLLGNGGSGLPAGISPGENLFNIGALESFGIPSLIAFIEEMTGREARMEDSTIEDFYTLESIYSAFVGKSPSPGRKAAGG